MGREDTDEFAKAGGRWKTSCRSKVSKWQGYKKLPEGGTEHLLEVTRIRVMTRGDYIPVLQETWLSAYICTDVKTVQCKRRTL